MTPLLGGCLQLDDRCRRTGSTPVGRTLEEYVKTGSVTDEKLLPGERVNRDRRRGPSPMMFAIISWVSRNGTTVPSGVTRPHMLARCHSVASNRSSTLTKCCAAIRYANERERRSSLPDTAADSSGQRPINAVTGASRSATVASCRTRQSASAGRRLGIKSFSHGRMMSVGPTTSQDETGPKRRERIMRPLRTSSPVVPWLISGGCHGPFATRNTRARIKPVACALARAVMFSARSGSA